MPVAKLSERFYQKFGHDLVEELVAWLNEMDSRYRTDLRELNELNFARFDAKLEQRIAEVKSELHQKLEQLRVELRAGLAEGRAGLQAGLAEVRADLQAEVAGLRGEFRAALEAQTATLVNWMLGFWIGQAVTTVGLVLAVTRLHQDLW